METKTPLTERLDAIKDITHRLCSHGMPRDSSIGELCVETAAFIANLESKLQSSEQARKEAEERARTLEDTLLQAGFVRCDIPACNCGAWHHRYGLAERWQEIKDELLDAEVLSNDTGNLPINAVKLLRTRADQATLALKAAEEDAGRKDAALALCKSCIPDLASGKGGWAWEEVLDAIDAAREANDSGGL